MFNIFEKIEIQKAEKISELNCVKRQCKEEIQSLENSTYIEIRTTNCYGVWETYKSTDYILLSDSDYQLFKTIAIKTLKNKIQKIDKQLSKIVKE